MGEGPASNGRTTTVDTSELRDCGLLRAQGETNQGADWLALGMQQRGRDAKETERTGTGDGSQ